MRSSRLEDQHTGSGSGDETAETIRRTLARIASRLERHGDALLSEEAIRTVLVAPLLTALGHDPADPDLVLVGHKTAEGRADYVVLDAEARQTMVVAVTSNPDDTRSPRAVSLAGLASGGASVAHLTDGRRHRLHLLSADGIQPEPFLAFDIGGDVDPSVLLPLSRGRYDVEEAVRAGRATRPADLAWDHLLEQMETEGGIHRLVVDHLVAHGVPDDRSRIHASEALGRAARLMREDMQPQSTAADETDEAEDRRPLTGDEQAATEIVREIVGRYVDPGLVFARPAKSYLALNYTDNNRKTICRLYLLSQSARYVGTFTGRDEKRQRVRVYAEVAEHAEAILIRLRELDPGAFHGRTIEIPHKTGQEAMTGGENGNPASGDAETGLQPPEAEPAGITSEDEDVSGITSDATEQGPPAQHSLLDDGPAGDDGRDAP